jgi:hypothetical protein
MSGFLRWHNRRRQTPRSPICHVLRWLGGTRASWLREVMPSILGKLVTRGDDWRPIGFALHVQNGAILGAAYARLKPSLPGPAVLRGLLLGLIEHVATWPMTVLVDRYHPARKELPKLAANRRAFGQATIRHAVFGIVLGLLEDALNDRSAELTL